MTDDSDEIRARIPSRPEGVTDSRTLAAWTAWLDALASDAEAAFAAAVAYESLDGVARGSWLDALEQDAPSLSVPKIAVYAPLLSVERDPDRLARIHDALGADTLSLGSVTEARALRGVRPDGSRVVVVVLPLYLSFVQVFSCCFTTLEGFSHTHHDPFARDADAPHPGAEVLGVVLERTPMKPVVEELAHAVLAQRRRGIEPPPELRAIADLFTPGAGEG